MSVSHICVYLTCVRNFCNGIDIIKRFINKWISSPHHYYYNVCYVSYACEWDHRRNDLPLSYLQYVNLSRTSEWSYVTKSSVAWSAGILSYHSGNLYNLQEGTYKKRATGPILSLLLRAQVSFHTRVYLNIINNNLPSISVKLLFFTFYFIIFIIFIHLTHHINIRSFSSTIRRTG